MLDKYLDEGERRAQPDLGWALTSPGHNSAVSDYKGDFETRNHHQVS